ncbi:MAG: dethiobiotin synthase [Gammaproteobacteria bacterium]|nr:dethiobiotin synthase [Gammaproteobacteria bacterium]MCP5136412.1 dethiobiotin synthase [Gammaproteobacteria bacterium]
MKGLFITGTDTDIGKTRITEALIYAFVSRGERVAGLKPIAAGCQRTPVGLRNDDALAMMRQANVELPYETVNPYAFEPPIAPHIAAAEAGIEMDPDVIQGVVQAVGEQADRVIVEGVGGWQVPIDDFVNTADLAELLGLPVIMVVGLRVGALNHALLTAEAIYARGVPIGGWLVNVVDPEMTRIDENIETLQRQIAFPYLGRVPWLTHPSAEEIATYLDIDAIGSNLF